MERSQKKSRAILEPSIPRRKTSVNQVLRQELECKKGISSRYGLLEANQWGSEKGVEKGEGKEEKRLDK